MMIDDYHDEENNIHVVLKGSKQADAIAKLISCGVDIKVAQQHITDSLRRNFDNLNGMSNIDAIRHLLACGIDQRVAKRHVEYLLRKFFGVAYQERMLVNDLYKLAIMN